MNMNINNKIENNDINNIKNNSELVTIKEDIKNNNKNNNKYYYDEITIIYKKELDNLDIRIFGDQFVRNNKTICKFFIIIHLI